MRKFGMRKNLSTQYLFKIFRSNPRVYHETVYDSLIARYQNVIKAKLLGLESYWPNVEFRCCLVISKEGRD